MIQQSFIVRAERLFWTIFSWFVNMVTYLSLPLLHRTNRTFAYGSSQKENLEVWFHCSSVGELSILKDIIPEYKKRHGINKVLISTFSTSSNALAQDHFSSDEVILFPLDIPLFHKRIVNCYSIKKIVIAETELWPFMLYQAHRSNIEVTFVNALITDSSFNAYLKISKIFPYFSTIDKVITKSEYYNARWKALGVNNVITGVDVKAPRKLVEYNREEERERMKLMSKAFIPILVSVREGEEDLFLDILDFSEQVIVVPRHVSRTMDEIIALCDTHKIEWVRSSYVNLEVDNYSDFKVIIVDEFGVMDTFYKVASCAFVGGTIADIGGHNILEPLNYSLPTCCGTSTYNQVFAVEVAKRFNLLKIAENKASFCRIMKEFQDYNDSKLNSALKEMINYIVSNRNTVLENL